jgi:DNA-binding transcriptional LysR family regulator
MDARRLETLLCLSRLGSMRAVADELRTTTSTVSQQIAVLGREVGTPLIEPAGRRLAQHAITILAAVEAARLDLDPAAEPAGTLRVAGFASAVRHALLPVAVRLAAEHPKVRLHIREHEPVEALALLSTHDIDLALTYDYNLAPATTDHTMQSETLWTTPWSLAVPRSAPTATGDAPAVFHRFRDSDWIVNSRSTADEHVVRTIASMAGYQPHVTHRADSLALVQDLILAGLGVGLLPADQPTLPGIRLQPLDNPDATLRAYAVVRRGRTTWPPLALVLDLLTASRETR